MESLERKLALREQAGIYGGLAGRIAGLSRAGQIVRSTVPVDGDDVPIVDSLEKVDDVAGRVNDAVEEVDSALEDAYEAAQEALEAKQKALEALADAIAALAGIEDLEADLTPQIVAAQAVADQAAQDALDAVQASADADAKAVQAAADAAVAAGIAAGKGKTIIQSAAPAAADRLAQNLWIDTTGGNNTPKRWSGSAWVAVTDKVAVDAAAAAVAAQSAADASRMLAEGLYQVIPSTTAPTTSPTGALKQGDQWWKIGTGATAGQFVGVAVWNGSAWQDRQLVADSVLVPGSAGSVVIKDGAVTAPKITASEELSAKVAEFIKVKASQLVADSSAMNSAFIKQLVGEQAFFDAMLTGRLIVAGSNLIPWAPPALIPFVPYTGTTVSGGTSTTLGNHAAIIGGTGTNGVLTYAVNLCGGQTIPGGIEDSVGCEPGQKYTFRVEVAVVGSVAAAHRQARVAVLFFNSAGANIPGSTVTFPTLTGITDARGQWLEGMVEAPVGAASMRVTVQKAFWSAGSLAVMTAEVMKSVGAVLIEDGAITAPKLHVDALNFKSAVGLDLTSGTVTGATVRTAASGQRLQMDVEGLKAYGPSGNVTANLSSSGTGMGLLGDIYFETSSGGKTNLLSFNGDDIHLGHTTSGLVNTLVVTPSSDQFQIETHRRVGGGEAPIIALHSRVTNPGNTFALKSQMTAWAAPDGTHAWVTSENREYVRRGGAWRAVPVTWAGREQFTVPTGTGTTNTNVSLPAGLFPAPPTEIVISQVSPASVLETSSVRVTTRTANYFTLQARQSQSVSVTMTVSYIAVLV